MTKSNGMINGGYYGVAIHPMLALRGARTIVVLIHHSNCDRAGLYSRVVSSRMSNYGGHEAIGGKSMEELDMEQ